jgi:WD40 repeat protein
MVVSGSRDTTLRVWDKDSRKEVRRFEGHKKGITAVALSPDGKTVASGDSAGAVHLWLASTASKLLRLPVLSGPVRSIVFGLDGKDLVTVCEDNTICKWETSTGRLLNRHQGQQWTHSGIGVSPNARTVICGEIEPEKDFLHHTCILHCWDLVTGNDRWKIPGEKDVVYWSTVFSSDGKYCAGSRGLFAHMSSLGGPYHDYEINLRETVTGMIVWRAKTHKEINSLAFSPDGRTLVGACGGPWGSKYVTLWDVVTGKEIGELAGHLSGINALTFSPDGKFLGSGGADYSVLIWGATWPGIKMRPWRVDPSQLKLEKLWDDLASADASAAHQAAWSMVFTPASTLPFLREQLRPVRPADARLLARTIADLDSDKYDIREKATRVLEEQGELAEGALRTTLKTEPSEETKRRIALLLARIDRAIPLPTDLRIMRATAVLERVGTAEARNLLKDLSEGAADARLTKQADSALQRLNR